MLKYSARHYDDQLRLKVSPLLWLILIYGIRHFFFLAAPKFLPLDVVDIGAIPWVRLQTHAVLILSDLPILLVLFSIGHRMPDASRVMRQVWLHGSWTLVCSYLLGIAVFIFFHFDAISNTDNHDFIAALCAVLPDIAIIAYLLRSGLIRDIFSDFPETHAELESISVTQPKPFSSVRQLEQELNEAKRIELLSKQIIEGHTPADLQIQPGDEFQGWMQSASKLESNGQLGEAESIYRELLKSSPNFAPAWHALGLLAYHAGKQVFAAALVEQAVMLDRGVGLYQRNLGEMYRRMGKLQEAVDMGRVACRLSPLDADAYHNLAIALTDAGLRKEALVSYREAVKLNPKHGLCWNNLGVLLQAMGDFEGARQAYSQALSLNPANIDARKNLQILLDGFDKRKE